MVTDGKKKWIGKGKIPTGRGLVDPSKPPDWASVFEAQFLDGLSRIKRGPQSINWKDVGLIVSLTGVGKGSRVAEGGSGSGVMTAWLARLGCRVYSYELRADYLKMARENLERLGLRASFRNKSVFELKEKELDLVLYDLPNPWEGVDAAHRALKKGGYFVAYLPTTNQVRKWLSSTDKFAEHRVVTSTTLDWKTDPAAFRPKSKTLAHTAFVCAARRLF